MKNVQRFDLSAPMKPIRLDNGWMKADAVITRIGVFGYRCDGKMRYELRPPDEVFKKDAVDSFNLVPVTVDHPPVGVLDAKTTREFQRGVVSNVHKDGANLAATLMLTDEDAIKDAENGRGQLSCGYLCDTEETPGVTSGIPGVSDGQRYDAIQRNIRGNHVALVYTARAGENARIRLDGMMEEERKDSMNPKHVATALHAYNQHVEEESDEDEGHDHEKARGEAKAAAMVAGADEKDADEVADHVHAIHMASCGGDERNDSKESEMKMKVVKIDGVDFEVSEQAAQAIQNIKDKRDEQKLELEGTKAEVQREKARADKAEELLSEAKKLDVTKLVRDRIALLRSADKLLGEHELKLDEMTDVEIKKAAIVAKFPAAKDKLKDESYINARFDAALEMVSDEKEPSALNRMRNPRLDDEGGDETIDLDKKRAKMIADGQRRK
jgi:hypothetical protein